MRTGAETFPRTYHATGEVRDNENGVLVVGPGANTRNMIGALNELDETGHEVHFAGVSTAKPAIPIEQGRLHETDTDEGRAALQQLLGEQTVHAAYISTPAPSHAPLIGEYLEKVADGEVDFVVTTKPMVQNKEELRLVEAAKKRTEDALRAQFGPEFNPDRRPVFLVHEHYLTKGSWRAVREQLPELVNRLGRLSEARVDIQEARTAKDEGRAGVVADGAFEDLGPHAMSLGLDAQAAINEDPNGRYLITDRSAVDISLVRHDDSDFPEGIETGFMIEGVTLVQDKTTGETQELVFQWCAGKGLVDQKKVELVFEHPDTGIRTTISVDLSTSENTVSIPEEAEDLVGDLFPVRKFDDNGYGKSVAEGLNGGDPRKSFQSFEQAKTVVIWGETLIARARAKGAPKEYTRGKSMQDVMDMNPKVSA